MRGPKPEPTAVKERKGNPGKRPLNDREPIPREGALTCPQHLNGSARHEWYRVLPALQAMGTAKPVDRAVLAIYCQAWGRWVEAEVFLKKFSALYKTSNGNLVQSPMLGVAHREEEIMLKAGAELGIGAATRSRIQVEKEGGEDALEALLRGDRTN